MPIACHPPPRSELLRGGWPFVVAMVACGGRTVAHRDAGPNDADVLDAIVEPDDAEDDADAPTPRVITTLASMQLDPCVLAVDSKSVYWTSCAGGSVKKVPRTGGAITTLVSGYNPGGFALDSTNFYWIDPEFTTTYVIKCPLAGCGATPTVMTMELAS